VGSPKRRPFQPSVILKGPLRAWQQYRRYCGSCSCSNHRAAATARRLKREGVAETVDPSS